jgi:hypothetical protein
LPGNCAAALQCQPHIGLRQLDRDLFLRYLGVDQVKVVALARVAVPPRVARRLLLVIEGYSRRTGCGSPQGRRTLVVDRRARTRSSSKFAITTCRL